MALFPFLPGDATPEVWPAFLTDRLAQAVAAVHRATPHLTDVMPPRDTFEVDFESDLRRALDAIEGIGGHDRAGLQALRDFIRPRRAEVLAQLERLHGLQSAARAIGGPLVLAHTDIGGANVLVDEHGEVALLDWDDVVEAPPEHDLQCALGQDLGRFLRAYLDAGGARPLHREHFAFYLLRRYLGDMTARFVRILHDSMSPEEDADALRGMDLYGFRKWAALDDQTAEVDAALRAVGA